MQRFSCETIQRWPGGTLRSLSIVGRWVFIPLGVAVAKALGRGADGHLFLLYIPIALLFAPYVIWELRSRVHTGGHLEVSEGRMRLSAPEVIVRLEQVIGIYAAEEGTLVIQLLDGTKIEVVLEEDWGCGSSGAATTTGQKQGPGLVRAST